MASKLGVDKLFHFVLSLLVCLISSALCGITFGIIITFVIGLLKELHDKLVTDGSGWSWMDLLADVIGIAAGAALYYTIIT